MKLLLLTSQLNRISNMYVRSILNYLEVEYEEKNANLMGICINRPILMHDKKVICKSITLNKIKKALERNNIIKEKKNDIE